jgi:hypothetical protein
MLLLIAPWNVKVVFMFWISIVYCTFTSMLPLLYVAVVVEAGMSEETHAVKLDPSANCNGGFTVKMNYTELL